MSSQSIRKWFWPVLLGLAIMVGGTACGQSEAEEGEAKETDAETSDTEETDGESDDDDERPPVEVAVLERGPIEALLRFSADLEAEASVPVYARAPYRITSLRVEEGDRVERGETLATLEREAQANALAKVESQLAKAERDYERQERLFEQELISQETFNQATYDQEQLEIARADARRELSYTNVQAPIGGTVSRRLVNVGDQVTVNQHLFDLVDFDSLVARVFVPERELARVEVGQPARIRAQALPGRVVEGRVERIAPVVDPTTGTVKVTVDVPYEQGLRPGMFLDVELVTAVQELALLVPKRALVLEDDETFVFRVTADGSVERVGIQPVLEDPASVAVSGNSLSVGDRVVVAGQAGIKSGDEVRVVGREAQPTGPGVAKASPEGAAGE